MADRVLPEPKIGIGINKKTGASEEGKLYRVGMNRLENKKGESLSVIIDFEGLDLPKSGMMKLGGEGKAASYQKSEPVNFSVDKSKLDGNGFKLYLSTPAIFKKGWLPDWKWRIDEKKLTCEYNGLKLKLLTASIGKPLLIGGFDMKTRKPKPMCKVVPAGSVYYFEGDFQKAFEIFDQTAISDVSPEQGFGIAYVGGVGKNV